MANNLEKRKYHFIYKTTNLLNGKYYIGMHSTNNLSDNYLGSGTYLKRSIRKYGRKNFKIEILHYKGNREELVLLEGEIVSEESIKDNLCMNLKPGGTGGFYFTREQLQYFNKKSQEKIKSLRENNKVWDKRNREIHSERMKREYEEGKREKKYFFNWKGKNHTEQTRLKQSLANRENHKGEANSQFGTCWITNEIENKKIYRGDLIPEGWRLGRKMQVKI